MRVAIECAGFTPGEADQLRRAMATFKFTGGVSQVRGQAGRRHGRATATTREFAEKTFSQLEGFGSYGFPESHAASLRADRLCLVLDEMPASGCLLRGAPQCPADGLLRAGADRARCARAWRRGPAGLRQRLALGLHAGADRARRPLRRPARPAHGARAWPTPMPPRSSPRAPTEPFASVDDLWRRAGVPAAALVQLAEADAFRPSLGLARREALWAIKALARRAAAAVCRRASAGSRDRRRRSTSRPSRCGR